MPKITFETKDAVPEGLRDIAAEAEGKFVIDVVPASFRDRNINLSRELDQLKPIATKVKELAGEADLDTFVGEIVELRDIAKRVKDGTLTKKDDIEAEVARRTAETKSNLESQIKELATKAKTAETEGTQWKQRWQSTLVDTAVTMAVLAGESGASPQALPDILNRARSVFRVKDDGSLVAMQGTEVLYGADGETSMQPKEWLAKLLKDAPYFAKSSAGGGATGDTTKGVMGSGLSQEAWDKLPARERLKRARAAQG